MSYIFYTHFFWYIPFCLNAHSVLSIITYLLLLICCGSITAQRSQSQYLEKEKDQLLFEKSNDKKTSIGFRSVPICDIKPSTQIEYGEFNDCLDCGEVKFTNTTDLSNSNYQYGQVTWTIRDSNNNIIHSQNGPNTSFMYPFSQNGTYTVTMHLALEDSQGGNCVVSSTNGVRITCFSDCLIDDFSLYFQSIINENCFKKNLNYTSIIPKPGYNYSYKWEIKKGSTVVDVISGLGMPSTSQTFTFPENGTYQVCLTIYGEFEAQKCELKQCAKAVIECVTPCQVENFNFKINNDRHKCFTKHFTITQPISPQSGYGYSHQWFIYKNAIQVWTSGTVNGTPSPRTYNFEPHGNGAYTVKLIVTKYNKKTSCTKEVKQSIKINCGNNDLPCKIENYQFTANELTSCKDYVFVPSVFANTAGYTYTHRWTVAKGFNNIVYNSGILPGVVPKNYSFNSGNGTYLVTLEVFKTNGVKSCSIKFERKVDINCLTQSNCGVKANFSTKQKDVDCTMQFVDLSTVTTSATSIIAWHWDFGDGSTSTQSHPLKTYASAGTYKVVLKVTAVTASGIPCQSTFSRTLTIKGPCFKLIENPRGTFDIPREIISFRSDKGGFRSTISPNPTDGLVYVSLKEACQACNLSVFSPEGKEVLRTVVNQKEFQLDLSKFQSGLYTIEIEAKEGKESFSVLKK